jgi:ATP-dependent protease HslVU (ClpYQ) ATPase subunit
MEKLFEEVSFNLPDPEITEVKIDADYVRGKFDEVIKKDDIEKYIL